MSLIEHAKKELELAGYTPLFDEESYMIMSDVLELIKLFSNQGHSGYSASIVSHLFHKLSTFQTISPLTGNDDEWVDITNDVYQNNRDSRVFKNKNNKSNFIDSIIWRNQKGITFTGTVDNISSSQNIKSFPFVPKSFYIDVIETEITKGNYESHIKNMDDLKEVFEYYKPI